ncbi:MAG: hypothetical protein P2A85_06215 [Microcoleus anatoxicus]|uniref:hypothetical protein n=1 Tax=Microcoleus anatoxicus TaxID=2705319 RepID=UPI003672AB2E
MPQSRQIFGRFQGDRIFCEWAIGIFVEGRSGFLLKGDRVFCEWASAFLGGWAIAFFDGWAIGFLGGWAIDFYCSEIVFGSIGTIPSLA